MRTMKEFDHIEGLHNVIKWMDAVGYDKSVSVFYRGTVKLDGTNAGVRFTKERIIPQSKTREITPSDDNFGFASWCSNPLVVEQLRGLEVLYRGIHGLSDEASLTLFGEWIGKGIAKGVAVSELPRQFVIINAHVDDGTEEGQYYPAFSSVGPKCRDVGIYTVGSLPPYEIELDFSDKEKLKKQVEWITQMTELVEKECPWAKLFDVSGVGEGIVWVPLDVYGKILTTHLWFKSKGELHKTVKSKEKVQVAPENLDGINSFVDFALADARLEQGISLIGSLEPRHTPQFLKWIADDVQRECAAELEANNLEWKAVLPVLQKKAREFFLAKGKEV